MADNKIKKVGFLGLGKMGAHMANNIMKAGFDLTVYNRTPEKTQPFVDKGAKGAATPREAASDVDVVITCLMDDESMLETVSGEDGILAGLKPGGIHIGTATVSPMCAAKLDSLHEEHGSAYVSGPIFGRPDAAEAGTLLTYVAGDPDVISACDELFDAYSGTHIYMGGDTGIVNSVKLSMNFMLVCMVELFSEVYTFAEKSGVELEFAEKLIRTVLSHPVLKEYTTRIRARDFEPAAFSLRAGFKDVELVLQASTEAQAPLVFASAVREKFVTAMASGMADKDWSAIYEITRKNAGL